MNDDERRQLAANMAELRAEMDKKTLWNWWWKRRQKMEHAYVDHDVATVRRIELTSLWFYFLALAVSLAVGLLATTFWVFLPLVLLTSWMAQRSAWLDRRAAHVYRDGWLLGRLDMLQSVAEARKRGLTEDEWMTACVERDFQVLW